MVCNESLKMNKLAQKAFFDVYSRMCPVRILTKTQTFMIENFSCCASVSAGKFRVRTSIRAPWLPSTDLPNS
jgi:hypothetical protein